MIRRDRLHREGGMREKQRGRAELGSLCLKIAGQN